MRIFLETKKETQDLSVTTTILLGTSETVLCVTLNMVLVLLFNNAFFYQTADLEHFGGGDIHWLM